MALLILAMFPGQGSQSVGMGKELLSQFPAVKTTFEEAEDATRINIRRLCFDGPDDELKLTANTQPCILTVSVAVWRVLVAETGLTPHAFAGHSLGEYSAAVAAGKLDFGRAAMLVRRRGEAMQEAVPAGVGAMAAILNVPAPELVAKCASLSKPQCVVEVVNFNSPQQLVVAGHQAAVSTLVEQLTVQGVRSVMLPVSAPFHSSLMTPAKAVMKPLLDETSFARNDSRLIANLTGELARDFGAPHLIDQIDHPVLWTQSLETAVKESCEAFVEVGPGKVLWGLARRSLPKTAKLFHTEDVGKSIVELQALG